MGHLALGLVLLAGTLAASSPPRRRDLGPLQEAALDMAPNSFDDQYRGCSRLMEEELEELNRTEIAINSVYAEAWTHAAAQWRTQQGHVPRPPALQPEHAVALLAYTTQEPLYREFNAAVREAGRSREKYLGAFHFKVLHFLLTEALRVLREAQPRRCHHVCRGVPGIRFSAQQHQSVRFGQFTSTSLQYGICQQFGQDTIFWVETCYGAHIRNFSFYPGEEEVLIPPFEIFEVTNVTHHGNGALIQLRSRDTRSTYNCELVKEKRCRSRACGFSAGRSVPRDPPQFWGLLLAATALAATGGP
ncbi:GPI-linked NAD(P)(+)--arginine ADP-ribosyltransferase 1 isoform X2 [Athene noctua]|uniref:GPI-linked NAD(P)(+)--arginine ADP-ribosyltransferase 1 isoform X2 n=1 Tax=Athene noctua TaxID=126797 RepID=UPI003EC0E521